MAHKDNRNRILVVDDEKSVRDVVSRILETDGYDVTPASGGKEALEIINNNSFDLMILDILMPHIDGYMLLELMPEKLNIPVIMLSGLNETSSKVTSFNLGADDYMTKPFSPGELLARVEAKLRRTKPAP